MTEDQLEQVLAKAKIRLIEEWKAWAGNLIDDQHERGDDDREGTAIDLVEMFCMDLKNKITDGEVE